MKRAFILFILTLVLFTFLPEFTSSAAENQGYPFAVNIIPPEEQRTKAGYFHVPGKPGEQKILKAELINLIDQPLEIKVIPMNAYSKQDGIFYESPEKVNSDKYKLADERYG